MATINANELVTIVEEVVADKVRMRGNDLDRVITYTLLRLGATSSRSGYHYIHKIVKTMVLNPYGYALFKEHYYSVAKSFNNSSISRNKKLTIANVERNIRYSIGSMWELHKVRSNGLMNILFGSYVDRPSNSVFLSTVAEYVKLVYFK